jgi:hypothetical protein
MTDLTVARTIFDHLGGERFVAMTGAKNFVGTVDSLTFKLGTNPMRVSDVRVTLTSGDLYAVSFFRVGRAPRIESDVYSGTLEGVICENTGLCTRLARRSA